MPKYPSMIVARSLGVLAMLTASVSASAMDPRWFGTWTLDRSASDLKGALITIGAAPHGYRFDFGAVRFDIGDDGRFYPTVPGRETSLKKLTGRSWLRVHRNSGIDADRSLLTLSRDERVLTIATTVAGKPAKVGPTWETFRRIGRGNGLAGSWRSTKLGVNVATKVSIGAAGGGKIQWGLPSDGNFYVVTPDGPPAANQGRTAVPGVTLVLKQHSPRELHWTELIDGKPYTIGTDTLAPSGHGLTETSWPAQSPGEKQTAIYRR